jgi:hypothetical protein
VPYNRDDALPEKPLARSCRVPECGGDADGQLATFPLPLSLRQRSPHRSVRGQFPALLLPQRLLPGLAASFACQGEVFPLGLSSLPA